MDEDYGDEGPYPITGPNQVLMWPNGERVGFGLKIEDGPTMLFECAPTVLENVIRELQAIKAKADLLAEQLPDAPVILPFPITDMQLGHDALNDQLMLTFRSNGPAWLGSFVSHDIIAGLFEALRTLLPRSPGLNRAMQQLGDPQDAPTGLN